MNRIAATLIAALIASPALAEGDAAKGEKEFNKCRSCHEIVSDAGEVIVKGGKTGPNLFGAPGRKAGSVDGFNYGADLVAAGEAGLVWDEESFAAYTHDPTGFLKEHTGNSKAKAKMTFKLKSGGEDIYAYLVSLGSK